MGTSVVPSGSESADGNQGQEKGRGYPRAGGLFGSQVAHKRSAARIVSTDGALESLPDSSLNILQENPTLPCG